MFVERLGKDIVEQHDRCAGLGGETEREGISPYERSVERRRASRDIRLDETGEGRGARRGAGLTQALGTLKRGTGHTDKGTFEDLG